MKKHSTPTLKELRNEAQELGIVGRYTMDKLELLAAITVVKAEKAKNNKKDSKAEKTDTNNVGHPERQFDFPFFRQRYLINQFL